MTFKADLIQGPTRGGSSFEIGTTSGTGNTGEGGSSLNKERNSDSEDEGEETEQEPVNTKASLNDYLLARDRARRQIKPQLPLKVETLLHML